METTPQWKDIDISSRILIEKEMFDQQKHQKLFHAFDYLKDYMDDERIKEYNRKSKPVVERWVAFFNHMHDLGIDCTPLDEIVSYVLTIPGNLFCLFNDIHIIYLNKFAFQEPMRQPNVFFR